MDDPLYKFTKEKLEYCIDHVTGRGAEFIESLYAFFTEKGYLSEKQLAALDKFYFNAIDAAERE